MNYDMNTLCNGCREPLYLVNYRIADGCSCNSPRGINHGRVPVNTCTCDECDPDQTGSTRYSPLNSSSQKYIKL